jgi:hypothetical protein
MLLVAMGVLQQLKLDESRRIRKEQTKEEGQALTKLRALGSQGLVVYLVVDE